SEVDEVIGIEGVNVLRAMTGDLVISDTSAEDDVRGDGTLTVRVAGEDAKLIVAPGARIARNNGQGYHADKMDLQGTIECPYSVQLDPCTAGRAIDLGSTTDTGIDTLELSDAELDGITAGTLRVGDADTGPITITSDIGPAGTDTWHLSSGSEVGQTAELFVSNLAVTASGEIALTRLNNDFDTLAAVSTDGNVRVWDADDVIVGTVDGVSGVGSQRGYVNLGAEDGNLTVHDTSAVADIGAASSVNITVRGEDAVFSLAPGTNVAGDQLVARADNMDLQGTIDCPYSVLLAPSTVGRAIDLGSTANTTANTLELSDAELGNLISERLHIGDIHAGDISITEDIDPASADMLHLTSGGSVTQTASLSVANLAVEADDAVTLTNAANDVDTLAAHSTANKVDYFDANGFTVDTVDALDGVRAGSGPVFLSANAGDLLIEKVTGAPAVEATGSISISALGEGKQLAVASGATLQSGASQDLRADRIDLQGSVAAGSNAARLRPSTAAWRIDLGSTANTTANTLELSDAELDRITTGTLRIGTSSSGAIDITDAISPAGTDTLHLTSDGEVNDEADGAIVVSNLAIESVGPVTLDNATADSGNSVEVLAAEVTGAGNGLHFENNGPLGIGSVDGISGISTNGGGITIVTHSPLTVNEQVADTAGGDIQLVASNDGGDDDNLAINDSVEASGGDGSIVLDAGTDLAINDSGGNSISASGTGTISANVARTAQLAIGVPLQTNTGSVIVTAQNASIQGTAGDDELEFTPGATEDEIDLMSGGTSVATLVVPTSGQIEASGGAGNDTVTVDSTITNPTTLSGGDGHDVLEGGGGDNTLDGGDGDDELIGGTGTNTLSGGDGDDTIEDGGGTNTVIGGSGSNTFVPGDGTNTFKTEPGSTVPEVYADTYSILEDDKLTVSLDQGVLANDLDPEERSLFAEAITSTAHGTVSLADDGSFTYCPFDDFNGTDTFTYRASNDTDTECSSEATVTIQVAPVNDAPVAATASLETDEDVPVDIDLRTLVSDIETENDDLLFDVGDAAHGSVALLEDGYTARFTPNPNFPSPNPTGAASFTYDVTDTGDPAGTFANAITVSETRIDVTVRNLVDLSGRVFNDRNNDGAFDDSQDVPLEGVEIQVWDDAMTEMFASDNTDSNGEYVLDADLAAGTYQLVEIYDDNPESASFEGLLDGKETAGSLGGDVVNKADSNVIANISVDGAGEHADAVDYLFAKVEPSDLFGRVWRDFNNDGEINFGESDIEDVEITLSGTDDRGNTVNMTAATEGNTGFAFTNLRPGDYTIEETQPTGFDDGLESLGTVTNPHDDSQSAIDSGEVDEYENDKFVGIKLAPGSTGDYYNFGELPQAGETVPDGSTASIGFWHNKNGQALISKLSDTAGENSTQLGDWLAATFPKMYGDGAYYDAARGQDRTMDLAGKSDEYVADTFGYLHQRNKKSMIENGGVPKVDAQVLALALSTYATNEDLAGTVAQNYGFSTSADGIAYSTFRVLDVLTVEEAEHLGLSEANGTLDAQGYSSIIDILSATDAKSTLGLLYDHDQDLSDGDDGGDELIDSFEQMLRLLANDLYTAINEQGGI
ncbi:MAG: Ig-like domain-containing protein, partial [Pirellulaceae bacterium]